MVSVYLMCVMVMECMVQYRDMCYGICVCNVRNGICICNVCNSDAVYGTV